MCRRDLFTESMKALLFCVILAIPSLSRADGPLKVHPENPRYLTDDSGRAIYLTGSHTWLNFQDGGTVQQPRIFDYPAYLSFLKTHNHNFVRLWTWEGSAWTWNKPDAFTNLSPTLYAPGGADIKSENDGKRRFDLTKFNQPYFDRLRDRVIAAGERDFIVGVELFEGFSIAAKAKMALKENGSPWFSHPFHRDNNINGIDGDLNMDDQGYEVHSLQSPEITRLQEAYVRKLIDTVNDLDNVIYEISNESHGASTPWQYHWIHFIREYEKTKPKQHLVWMSFQWDGFDRGTNATLYGSEAEIISPADHDEKGFLTAPPVSNGSKVIILDTDHIKPPDRERLDWVWKTFTRGMHSLLMDDPFLDVKSEKDMVGAEGTRLAMGDTLAYAKRIDLAATEPTDDPVHCSTGFCLRHAGHEYLVYQPVTGPVTAGSVTAGPFTVLLETGAYRYEWFDARNHEVVSRGTIYAEGGEFEFTPPFETEAVLYLKNTDDLAGSGPGPGDVFREYHWTKDNQPHFVTGNSLNPRYPNKARTIKVSLDLDLEQAVRADVVIEHWTGHYGSSGKEIQYWQHEYRFTDLARHVGTATASPHEVTWDTQWVPDQDQPIRLMARITDASGLITMTPVVGGLNFARDRSVRMFAASNMPEGFRSRLGKSETCTIQVDSDLAGARAARIVVSAHASHELPGELGLNGKVLTTIPPSRPHFGVEVDTQFDVPLDLLQTGKNTFFAASETKAHPLAIMWPGPVLLVEFPRTDESSKSLPR